MLGPHTCGKVSSAVGVCRMSGFGGKHTGQSFAVVRFLCHASETFGVATKK